MNFHVISLMPDLVQQALDFGVVGGAFKRKLCQLNLYNPRDFSQDTHQTVDDRPFGGGDGMLMMPEPLQLCLENVGTTEELIYLSPQGSLFKDSMARSLSLKKEITLICGRYGGIDRRFIMENGIREISIGDYILSGGELAAAVVIDSIVRHIPGVLGHICSSEEDSFKDGFLESPGFTRPRNWRGKPVPEILLSGDHGKIEEYRKMTALVTTLLKRPELLENKEIPWGDVYNYFKQCSDQDTGFCQENKREILMKIMERMDG